MLFTFAPFASISFTFTLITSMLFSLTPFASISLLPRQSPVFHVLSLHALICYLLSRQSLVFYVQTCHSLVCYLLSRHSLVFYVQTRHSLVCYFLSRQSLVFYVQTRHSLVCYFLSRQSLVFYVLTRHSLVCYLFLRKRLWYWKHRVRAAYDDFVSSLRFRLHCCSLFCMFVFSAEKPLSAELESAAVFGRSAWLFQYASLVRNHCRTGGRFANGDFFF